MTLGLATPGKTVMIRLLDLYESHLIKHWRRDGDNPRWRIGLAPGINPDALRDIIGKEPTQSPALKPLLLCSYPGRSSGITLWRWRINRDLRPIMMGNGISASARNICNERGPVMVNYE